MHVSVYRCRKAYLLVPTCFLPSMEAIATHGPARYRGTMHVTGLVVESVIASMDARAYVTLALDHPMTTSPQFPGAVVAVGGEMGGVERRGSVTVKPRSPLASAPMPEPVDRRTGGVDSDRRDHAAHRLR
jgi:hypothetical protein